MATLPPGGRRLGSPGLAAGRASDRRGSPATFAAMAHGDPAVRRHLLVGSVAVVSMIAVFLVLQVSNELWAEGENWRKADGLLWRYNVATGVVSLGLLATTLSVGALRVLAGGRPAVHLPNRRVLGIWAAIATLAHVPGGLAIHSDGWAFWRPFARILPTDGDLIDPYSVAYWAGLVGLACITVLAWTSRDRSMRSMGADRWKRLHRLAYVAAAAVFLHVVAMQVAERRALGHATLTGVALLALIGLPAAAYASYRARSARSAPGEADS